MNHQELEQLLKRRFSWNGYLEFAQQYTAAEITDDLRQRWIASIQFLRQELGEGFFDSCGKEHPFRLVLENARTGSTSGIQRLLGYAHVMQTLKQNLGSYQKLLDKIRPRAACVAEGRPFIDVAEMYLQKGYDVLLSEEDGQNKCPDLEIRHPQTGERFFIEISKINPSKPVTESTSSYDLLFKRVWLFRYVYSCRLKKSFDEVTADAVAQQILKICQQAEEEDNLLFHDDEYISLAAVSIKQIQKFDQWLIDCDQRKGLHGVPLNLDETHRIANNKIKKECEQIPNEHSGVIYIPVSPLSFLQMDPYETSIAFQKQLQCFSNIIGIVLFGEIESVNGEFCVSNSDFIRSRKVMYKTLIREMLFVSNPAYIPSLSDATLDAIYSTFSN